MASEHLPGIRLKINRAYDHIELLRKEVGAFIETNPYIPEVQFNDESRKKRGYRELSFAIAMRVKKPCPPMWSISIGEVVHNLRSALDNLVYELVIHDSGVAPSLESRTQFPIFGTPGKFERHRSQMLSGVRDQAATLIRDMQPFETGEGDRSPLMHLSQLSNFDKHRTIHLTGATLTEFKFTFPPALTSGHVISEKRDIGAFEDNTVFVRGTFFSEQPVFRNKVEVQADVRLDIAFDQRSPLVGNWLMCDTLAEIADRTHACIQKVSRNVFGKRFDL